MANNNTADGASVIEISVLIEGKEMSASVGIMSIEVTKLANKLPSATICVNDGDIASQEFDFADSKDCVPGSAIEIRAGDASKSECIFKGLIVEISVELSSGVSATRIECTDKATELSIARNSATFVNQSDSSILNSIISAGCKASAEVDATSFTHPCMVKYYATDWEFILSRAKANAMIVYVEDNKVSIKKVKAPAGPVLTLTVGTNIMDFDGRINARPMVKEFANSSWDSDEQKRTEEKAGKLQVDAIGDIATAKLADVFSVSSKGLLSDAVISSDSLSALAEGDEVYAHLASKTGSVRFFGNAKVHLGDTIELKGVSKRFNGKALVTGVSHHIEDGNWTTKASFGLHATMTTNMQSSQNDIDYGAIPKVSGLLIGTVLDIHDDPESGFRIKVDLPSFNNANEEVWARLKVPYASNEIGFFFYPEINDEVIVGFVNDDPNSPIVMGCVHNKKIPPENAAEQENFHKSIITRSKLALKFDDEKTIFTINTPKEQTFCLNDDEGSVSVKDCNGNSLVMDESGITLSSDKDITIKAGANVKTTAGQEIACEATTDLALSGLNIKQTGDASVNISAPQVEASGSAMVTIKGGMVMIN